MRRFLTRAEHGGRLMQTMSRSVFFVMTSMAYKEGPGASKTSTGILPTSLSSARIKGPYKGEIQRGYPVSNRISGLRRESLTILISAYAKCHRGDARQNGRSQEWQPAGQR